MDDLLKNVWPEWRIEGPAIGRGYYGVVYKAVKRERDLESYAAVKVISIPRDESEYDTLIAEGLTADNSKSAIDKIVNGFVNEIKLMETFKGVQNIVSVEDYKVCEKEQGFGYDIFIRMELLNPFAKNPANHNMDEAAVIKLGTDICTALELLEKKNVIHRDIKPQNIFVNQFGDFKLGDFGIARCLESTMAAYTQRGTFGYMAPEVARGGEYDKRADLYSLGLVLYYCLNKNRLPFLDTEKQLLDPFERDEANRKRLSGEQLPVPCMASEGMAKIILRACEFDPDDRFASPSEMKQALLALEAGDEEALKGMLPSDTKAKRTRKAKKKSKRKAAVIAAACAAAALGLFVLPKLIAAPEKTGADIDPDTAVQTDEPNDDGPDRDGVIKLDFLTPFVGNTADARTGEEGDRYRIELEENGLVTLKFDTSKQEDDAEYWRLGISREEAPGKVLWETAVSGSEEGAVSPVLALSNGSYLVSVESTKGSDHEYTLSADYEENDGSWEAESNDSPESANRIEVNKTYNGVLQLPSGTGEEDWYSLEMSEATTIKLVFSSEQQKETDAVLYRIEVYKEPEHTSVNSTELYANIRMISTPEISVDRGTYCIRILSGEEYSSEQYSFEVQASISSGSSGENAGAYDVEVEPNDTFEEANPMVPGVEYICDMDAYANEPLDPSSSSGKDIFRFELEYDCLIKIKIDVFETDWLMHHGAGDAYVYAAPNEVPSSDILLSCTFSQKGVYSGELSLAKGVYYIGIICTEGRICASYSVRIDMEDGEKMGDIEPNGYDAPKPVALFEPIEGIISNLRPTNDYVPGNESTYSDYDYFAFELEYPSIVWFEFENAENCNAALDILYCIGNGSYDSECKEWQTYREILGKQLVNRQIILKPGHYIVSLSGKPETGTTGKYSFCVCYQKLNGFIDSEPNDARASANEAPINTEFYGVLEYSGENDEYDYYSFTLDEPTKINLSIFVDCPFEYNFYLCDGAARLLNESGASVWAENNIVDSSGMFSADDIQLEAGTYYLEISSGSSFGYSVKIGTD